MHQDDKIRLRHQTKPFLSTCASPVPRLRIPYSLAQTDWAEIMLWPHQDDQIKRK